VRQAGCPTDLELEAHLLDEAKTARALLPHVSGCPLCAERLAWMRAAGDRFLTEAYPSTAASVRAAGARLDAAAGPRWPRRWGWLAALPAAAALALMLRWPASPPEGYVGAKGSAVAFEVYAREQGSVRRIADGGTVASTAGLRFEAMAEGRLVVVLSVDQAGTVSRLQPPAAAPPVPANGLLPGGAQLDGVPGPERIFAVFVEDAASISRVEASTREIFAGGGAEKVRTIARLQLPYDQASVLLEKAGTPR
jgi:hypothetical protein